MKTVAQWAEQLPELIKIEFLRNLLVKEGVIKHNLLSCIDHCVSWKGDGFWGGVYDNELIEPRSADYIDETIPYTKEEVEAMILEFADPNDEVCKVMLLNIAKPREVKSCSPIIDIQQNEPCYLFPMREGENLQQFAKRIEQENEALKSTIYRLEKENNDIMSEKLRLSAVVQKQNADMSDLQKEFYPLHRELNEAKSLLHQYRAENGNKWDKIEELMRRIEIKDNTIKALEEMINGFYYNELDKTKPETNHKPTLFQRFLNLFQ